MTEISRDMMSLARLVRISLALLVSSTPRCGTSPSIPLRERDPLPPQPEAPSPGSREGSSSAIRGQGGQLGPDLHPGALDLEPSKPPKSSWRLLPSNATPGRNSIHPPPPSPPFLAIRHVQGRGMVCIFWGPTRQEFYTPPPPAPLEGSFQGGGGVYTICPNNLSRKELPESMSPKAIPDTATIWAHCPRLLVLLRKNEQEESGLFNLRCTRRGSYSAKGRVSAF